MASGPDLRELDAAGVQAMLRRLHPDVIVDAVDVVERARCGDGIASTADRIVLDVAFAPGHDAALPSRMVLKTLLLHPWLRFGLPSVRSLASASRTAATVPGVGGAARSWRSASTSASSPTHPTRCT